MGHSLVLSDVVSQVRNPISAEITRTAVELSSDYVLTLELGDHADPTSLPVDEVAWHELLRLLCERGLRGASKSFGLARGWIQKEKAPTEDRASKTQNQKANQNIFQAVHLILPFRIFRFSSDCNKQVKELFTSPSIA